MIYEMMVGLNVSNDQIYQEYRAAMTPLLQKHGGGFRYDFIVSQVLKSEASHPINRVFAIYFSDLTQKEAFFAHPEYLKIKESYFNKSVKATTIISAYNRES